MPQAHKIATQSAEKAEVDNQAYSPKDSTLAEEGGAEIWILIVAVPTVMG